MSDADAFPRRLGATPYLSVAGAHEAIAFYQVVFDARPTGSMLTGPDGEIMHAELMIGETAIMLSEENKQAGYPSPATLGDTPVRLMLTVADADATMAAAEAAGAEVLMPAADQFYGDRVGRVRDPFGHVWIISQVIESLLPDEMQRRLDALFAES